MTSAPFVKDDDLEGRTRSPLSDRSCRTMTRSTDPIASGSLLLLLLLFLFFFGSRAELPKLRRNGSMSPHTIGRSAEARYQMFPTFRGNVQGRTITWRLPRGRAILLSRWRVKLPSLLYRISRIDLFFTIKITKKKINSLSLSNFNNFIIVLSPLCVPLYFSTIIILNYNWKFFIFFQSCIKIK